MAACERVLRLRAMIGNLTVCLFILNVLVLNHAPDWVRASVLAISTLVFQGAVAVGSAT